jgi:hypothetical protein
MRTTLTHGRPRIVGLLGALTVALLAAAPAHAAGGTAAVCTTRFTATITPGFSTTAGSGTFTTNGQTGTMSCVGRIGGDRVTGPGSVAVEEGYTGACVSHSGTGTVRVMLPTTGGMKDMTGARTIKRTGLVVHPEVRFPGARYSGIGVSIPKEGNCFVTPLRRALVLLVGVIRGT